MTLEGREGGRVRGREGEREECQPVMWPGNEGRAEKKGRKESKRGRERGREGGREGGTRQRCRTSSSAHSTGVWTVTRRLQTS
jgi:hypothetical protein